MNPTWLRTPKPPVPVRLPTNAAVDEVTRWAETLTTEGLHGSVVNESVEPEPVPAPVVAFAVNVYEVLQVRPVSVAE